MFFGATFNPDVSSMFHEAFKVVLTSDYPENSDYIQILVLLLQFMLNDSESPRNINKYINKIQHNSQRSGKVHILEEKVHGIPAQ